MKPPPLPEPSMVRAAPRIVAWFRSLGRDNQIAVACSSIAAIVILGFVASSSCADRREKEAAARREKERLAAIERSEAKKRYDAFRKELEAEEAEREAEKERRRLERENEETAAEMIRRQDEENRRYREATRPDQPGREGAFISSGGGDPWGCPSILDLNRAKVYVNAGDVKGSVDMMVDGDLFSLEAGDRFLVLQVSKETFRVRVLSGKQVGKELYVPSNFCVD